MRLNLFIGGLCLVLGFLTHWEWAAAPLQCLPPAEAAALRGQVVDLQLTLMRIQVRLVEFRALAHEVEVSCGRCLEPAAR